MSFKRLLSLIFARKTQPDMALEDMKRRELADIQKAYARLFSSAEGKIVLSHLQATVFLKAYGADALDTQIRFAEGQRALVFQMMRHIEAGKGNT